MKYDFDLETLKEELAETRKEYRLLLEEEGTQQNCTRCLKLIDHIEFLKDAIKILER